MGTVWAARHELLGRDFALKFARVRAQDDSAARARFQTEAQLLGKLRHPNIVDVTDFGEVSPDGDFFLAMELLEGESLADRIARHGHLESYESVAIVADVARGLAAVHAVGIVHRDVKPENIFLARSPTGIVVPKLLDFGISKERSDEPTAQQRGLTGTPAYMSPEQANGETQLDPRTDIWSLGVVLYEMLTGTHPFVEPNYQALMTAIAERPYRALDKTIPASACRIVDRCLAKRPAERFASCDELAAALATSNGEVAHSPKPKANDVRGKPRGVVFGAVAVVVLIGTAIFWLARTPGPTPGASSAATSMATATSLPASAVSTSLVTDPSINVLALPQSSSAPTTAPGPSAVRSNVRRGEKRVSTSVTTPGF
jgi:eukaryotic-like serine/threonine-protein kinase